jgi:hypothetical protein
MRCDYSSLRHGLVGAWCPSLGATGYRLIDRSGMGNHGESAAGLAWAASPGRSVLSGNGTTGVSLIADRSALRITSGTITGWFQIGSVTSSRAIFSNYSQNSAVAGFTIGTAINGTAASTNRLSIVIGRNVSASGSDYGVWAATGSVLDSILHSFACVILPSGEVQFWIDGAERATTRNLGTQVSPVYATNSFVRLGGEQRSVGGSIIRHWPGLLDDIRVYNRVLTPQEIRLLASRSGIGLTPSRQSRTSASRRRLYQNVGGTWKETLPMVNVGGTWKEATVYENVGGTWKN